MGDKKRCAKYAEQSKRTTGKSTRKKDFYFTILGYLKHNTKLDTIKKKLNISKQQLNYYLRQLKKKGYLNNKGYGWWELTTKSKRTTKYDTPLVKDSIRGHAYVWEIQLPKVEGWDKRLDIIKKKKINHKLVGALKTTPRIKALGRKVWLCNTHLRIFDTKKASYYGDTAIEARKNSFLQLLRIVKVLENKLGLRFKPFRWTFKKEHYALVKNDLAIDQNRKGIIIRVSDEEGEWLLIDDSLEEGGELETIGKKAFDTNIPMQKWWTDHKKNGFQVTPTFLLNSINQVTNNQAVASQNTKEFAVALNRHIPAYEGMTRLVGGLNTKIGDLSREVGELKDVIKEMKK